MSENIVIDGLNPKVLLSNLSYVPNGAASTLTQGRQSNSKYTSDDIKKLLSNHVENASKLRDMSDYLYNTNSVYRRLIDTSKNLVSYEHSVVSLAPNKSTTKQKNIKSKIQEYLWDCNLEATLDDILFKLLKYGRYSAFDRGKYLQPLPLDFTRLIGVAMDGNHIIQFDFSYFDQFTNVRERDMQLKGYDPIFRKMYMDYKNRVDNPKVNFSNDLNWRTLPDSRTYTLKIGSNMESKEGMGILYGSVDDMIYYDELRDLDRNVINSQRKKIVVQTVPVNKDGHSILSSDQIQDQHNNLKSILPPNVACLTVLGGTNFDQIPLNLSALEKGKSQEVQSDILLGSGLGESALKGGNFSSGVLNVEIVTNTLVKILKQIENVWFNRKFKEFSDEKNRFHLKFLGVTTMNREDIIKSFDGLLDKGGNLTLSINARGFDLTEYVEILKYENDMNVKDLFRPLQTSHTTSDKTVGRTPDSGDGGDNSDKAKANGGNSSPRA